MPRPIFYSSDANPMSRAVRLTAAAIGLDIDHRDINLLADEHPTKKLTKVDVFFPNFTLPTFDDNGYTPFESPFIMSYLVNKYAKDDSLYPKDISRQILVDQHIDVSAELLYFHLKSICSPLLTRESTEVSGRQMASLDRAYGQLNRSLEGRKWLCGDSYTLADISFVTTISSAQCIHPIDDFPNIKAWLKHCEDNLPGYATINLPGSQIFHKAITELITSKGNPLNPETLPVNDPLAIGLLKTLNYY